MTKEEASQLRVGDIVFINEYAAANRGLRGTVVSVGEYPRVQFPGYKFPTQVSESNLVFASLDHSARERMERDARLAHAMEEAEYYVRLTGLGERG